MKSWKVADASVSASAAKRSNSAKVHSISRVTGNVIKIHGGKGEVYQVPEMRGKMSIIGWKTKMATFDDPSREVCIATECLSSYH
jgi:hypothetical protein